MKNKMLKKRGADMNPAMVAIPPDVAAKLILLGARVIALLIKKRRRMA